MHPKTLLEIGAELMRQCLLFEQPSDTVLARFFREHRQLGSKERAALSDAVYAVLRHKLLFDHLAPSGSGPRERRLMVLGLLYRPAARDAREAPSTYQTVEYWAAALTDVERRWLDNCQDIDTANLLERHRHNLPEWLVAPLKAAAGADFWDLAQSLNQNASLDLRVNEMTSKRREVQAELRQAGVHTDNTAYSPWGLRVHGKPNLTKLDAFTRGAVEVQDEGSQLLALILEAKRGEMVVDFCAGAGGKTLALGAAMRNTGRLYAFDTSAHRLEALKPRLARSGLSNVHPAALAHERDERIKRLAGKIDRVLVDAPCSGLGTLRRHPDLKWRQTPESVQAVVQTQAAILHSAARLLKSGGRLVYATCSLLEQENEQQAAAFGSAHPEFVPLPVQGILEHLKVPNASALCQDNYLRLWPQRHGTDGFFAAVWQKK